MYYYLFFLQSVNICFIYLATLKLVAYIFTVESMVKSDVHFTLRESGGDCSWPYCIGLVERYLRRNEAVLAILFNVLFSFLCSISYCNLSSRVQVSLEGIFMCGQLFILVLLLGDMDRMSYYTLLLSSSPNGCISNKMQNVQRSQ